MNNQNKVIDYCVNKIISQTKNPLLVAITGESGSGKSQFIKLLLKKLDELKIAYSLVNHDDFLIPRIDRENLRKINYEDGEFKGKNYWEILENWYYLDNFQSLIKSLQQNKDFTYYPYAHDTGQISNKPKIIKANKIIILENKLFLDQMDFVIELRVDRENVIKRKIKRDSDVRTPEQTIEMHKKAQGYFWDRRRPQNSDIIIDNNDFENPKILEK